MTAQQKQQLLSVGQLLNQVSSVGAFIGAIIIIVQIGEYKGTMETTVKSHDRRIERIETKVESCELQISAHHGEK